MTIFKVGDKARIRKDLKDGEMYDTCNGGCCYCNASMSANYRGLVVVVSEKSLDSGFMHLRKVEDGFTTEIPWQWSDDMLEPLEEEKKKREWLLKVGDEVFRKPEVNSEDVIDGIFINRAMYNATFDPDNGKLQAGKIAKIEEMGGVKVALVDFLNGKGVYCHWPLSALVKAEDCYAKPKFKVGDKVVIKTTVSSGERIDNVTIQPFMFEQAFHKGDCTRRKIGIVRRVDSSGRTGDVDFDVKNESVFTWPFEAFDKLDRPSKPSNKKRKKLDFKADYSGYTPKSEFYCYDYLNRKATFCRGAMGNITKIEVTVMSGDETGCFYGVLSGEPWQHRFDANTSGNRFTSYDDGSYTVEGR